MNRPHTSPLLAITVLAAVVCAHGCGGGSSSAPPDRPPTVSQVGDRTVPANSEALSIGFTVSDDVTDAAALTVSAGSDSVALLAGNGLTVAGSGGDRELRVAPAPGAVGMATITVTVTDGTGQSASTSFLYTVTPQQVAFNTSVRSAFAADENDVPETVNDKEYNDDGSTYDDLLSN